MPQLGIEYTPFQCTGRFSNQLHHTSQSFTFNCTAPLFLDKKVPHLHFALCFCKLYSYSWDLQWVFLFCFRLYWNRLWLNFTLYKRVITELLLEKTGNTYMSVKGGWLSKLQHRESMDYCTNVKRHENAPYISVKILLTEKDICDYVLYIFLLLLILT